LLGLLVFPLVHLAFPGLKDKGYAFARITGMLLFALISWWVGSLGIPVTRTTLLVVLLVIALVNTILALLQKKENCIPPGILFEFGFTKSSVFFLRMRSCNIEATRLPRINNVSHVPGAENRRAIATLNNWFSPP
jgi:uncharacterized membrane protein